MEQALPDLQVFMDKLDKAYSGDDKKALRPLLEDEWPLIHSSLLKPLSLLIPAQAASVGKVYQANTALAARLNASVLTLFFLCAALLLATAQVYFRDTNSFLPYLTRIWLYVSPVLWYPEDLKPGLRFLEIFNPLYPLLGGWGDLLVRGELIPWTMWAQEALWAFGTLFVGMFVFMSRERDFAVRL